MSREDRNGWKSDQEDACQWQYEANGEVEPDGEEQHETQKGEGAAGSSTDEEDVDRELTALAMRTLPEERAQHPRQIDHCLVIDLHLEADHGGEREQTRAPGAGRRITMSGLRVLPRSGMLE
jgi:FKBP-type peptidyl-prolyl cis-trans isomerase (trigger factor)